MQTLTQTLSPEQQALLPTDEDIAFYEEHGWYISNSVLSDDTIDQAILGSKQFYQGARDRTLPVSTGYSNWRPEDGDIVRNNEFVSLQSYALRQLALNPMIGAIAARLARTRSVRLLDDQLVYKPPMYPQSTVGWHADRAYWGTCSSHNLLTAWVPFHDCDALRGSLVVLDKSHRWSNTQNTRFFNNPNLGELEEQFRQQGRQVVKVPMTLKKGQVSFHHCWTIHGSFPNKSPLSRLALAVHLQDEENHYQSCLSDQGKPIHIFDETLCRKHSNGDPDFSDPNVFPVLWSEPSSF